MVPDRETLLRFLGQQRIDYREAEHAAVYNMAESALLELDLPGCRCKNLLVQSKKGDRLLLVTSPDAATDLGALGRELGIGRLSLCPASEMQELLGVAPGAVSPFALIADRRGQIRLLMDEDLRAVAHFQFHPLVNTSTVAIDAKGLERFLAATDHAAVFVTMPRRAPVTLSPASP